MATAAGLRLWGLGAQSQWFDEMLVTVHAANSLAYLTDLSWRVEIHPPLYYWFNHLLQWIWANDAFVRLPSALAGIASIPLIGLVAARLGSGTAAGSRLMATTAMALASVNPLHIWISRQVRPYALIQIFCCLGFLLLFRLIATPTRRDVLRLVAVNFPIVAMHYVGLVIMACQGLCLVAARLTRLGVTPVRDILLFAVGSVVTALPSLAFLASVKWLHTQSYASAFIQASGDLGVTTSKLTFQLLQFFNFGYFDGQRLWLLPAAAMSLGLLRLWRANPGRALCCLLLTTAFPLLLLAIRYTGHFTPVHLSYALPLLFACLAAACTHLLPRALRSNWSVLVLLAVLGGVFVLRDGRAFYHPDAAVCDAWHDNQERYKRIAHILAANTDSQSFVIFDDNFAAGAVDWYMRAATPAGSLADYAVTPEQKQVNLFFFSKMLAHVTPEPAFAFVRDAPLPPPFAGPSGNMPLYRALILRTGQIDWSPSTPYAGTLGLPPHTFLRHVHSLRRIRFFADQDQFWMCPALTGQEGEITLRFVSPSPFPPGPVYLVVDARMHRPGNRLGIDVRFDHAPYASLAALAGQEVTGPLFLQTTAKVPFTTMDVRLRPYVSGDRANRIDNPLEQVRLASVQAYVVPEDNRLHSRTLRVAEHGLDVPMPDEAGGVFRWGYDVSTLTFARDHAGPVILRYAADSPLPGQRGTVSVNGVAVAAIDLATGPGSGEITFAAKPGENVVTLAWTQANRGAHAFSPTDARPLAVRYRRLALDSAADAVPPSGDDSPAKEPAK
ncbi:glycosyltransferase family 39 protein [Desulfovibrio sp. TomC]|uniref:glycosyltransferase family 39 protein n=1 Tax=Desulfovibrio sp. TomC TaxID=1562888 RepID=UPI000574BF0D|nr:hypothetical protein [Desulfovibrio sp. TomC]KHK03517.1 putative inner membrane protein [Desulfovibrio sp. TomC]